MSHTAPPTVSTTSSSYTSQDYSYFSPQTPFTSPSPSTSSGTLSVPNSPLTNNPSASAYGARSSTIPPSAAGTTTTTTTTTTTPGGPIIISTITLRNNSHISSASSAVVSRSSHGSNVHSSHPPHSATDVHQSNDDVLQEFALHIPPPPTLSLSLSAQRNPSSSSVSSSQLQSGGAILNSNSPQMSLSSTPEQHTLSVQLPRNVQPEMVTISANKGDRLRVVADAWGGGNECHYEWQISFPPHDVDMANVHARFDPNGRLTLDVKRRAAMRARYY